MDDVLRGKTLGFIGYGNQGRAQALNLRDSGVTSILIGNRSDDYLEQITEDNFASVSLVQASAEADIVFLLVPDEVLPDLYKRHVEPNLKTGATLVFASGYNITYGHITPAADLNVVLVAPRMIGAAVRERKLSEQPVPCFLAVEQDATGAAEAIAHAVAMGIGATQDTIFKVTFEQETFLDLLSEQAVYPIILRTLVAAFKAAVTFGCPAEAALLELYGSEEPAEVMKQVAQKGILGQLSLHSRTSQYGQLKGFEQAAQLGLEAFVESILQNRIIDGSFDKEWLGVQQQGDALAEQLEVNDLTSLLEVETSLRQRMYGGKRKGKA